MELDAIVAEVAKYQVNYVTVTGGEPLAQPECWSLLTELADRGYQVSLETGGAIPLGDIDPRVYIVLDVKTPASNEEPNNVYENLALLKPTDGIKFVICNHADYLWAKQLVEEHKLTDTCEVFFSPSADQQSATELADWIVGDQLKVRMQVQLHKILWDNEAGR